MRLLAVHTVIGPVDYRRGELLYLRWQAVDLDAGEVTFGGSTAVIGGQRARTAAGQEGLALALIERHPEWAGQDWIAPGVGCLCAEHAA